MNDKFDQLARNMAQSVSRRGALKKFGTGLVGMALAALGLRSEAWADQPPYKCSCQAYPYYGCESQYEPGSQAYWDCVSYCLSVACPKQHGGKKHGGPY